MAVKVTKKMINDAIKPLRGKTPDEIADLIKGSVGKAYCRHAEKCAIAQFVADQLPVGYSVEVDGENVYVYALDENGTVQERLIRDDFWGDDWEPVQNFVELPKAVQEFIKGFDELKYPDLVHTNENGEVLSSDNGDVLHTYTADYQWVVVRVPEAV